MPSQGISENIGIGGNMTPLAEMQQWLGTMLAQPLQKNHLFPPLSPFGTETEMEAAKYIAPSRTLPPYFRLQIYHQQYWWRLLDALQTNFPFLLRLFGYTDFQNQLAIPYLSAEPPNHWALCILGKTFPKWLQENYRGDDHYLITTAALIDWATQEAFWIGALPSVDFAQLSPEEIPSQNLILQPFIHLFALKGDFFTFRDTFLQQEPEHYDSHPFPELHRGEYHFVLYRAPNNVVTWREISHAEFWMLSQFKGGCTLEKACEQLEGEEFLDEALSLIPLWFKQWTVLKWFGSSSSF